jgi:hypothetical protein
MMPSFGLKLLNGKVGDGGVVGSEEQEGKQNNLAETIGSMEMSVKQST